MNDRIRALIHQEQPEVARALALEILKANPSDAQAQYDAACVHDYLGFEREAVPFYLAALEGDLSDEDRRGAHLGLGSTYRTLGQYEAAFEVLTRGLTLFPGAKELVLFRAMTMHNLGQFKEAFETILGLLGETSSEPALTMYARAIALYAEDINRTW
jgi:tetratricopeptide (TPR) repeat protein